MEIHIKLCSPTKRKWDVDNRAKVVLDSLVRNGIIEADDSSIVSKLTLEATEGGTVGALVTIRSISEEGA